MLKHWRGGLLSPRAWDLFECCCCGRRWGTMACLVRSLCPSPVCSSSGDSPSPPACLCCGLLTTSPSLTPHHFEEFGLYQILAVLEKNHCYRATSTDVAVLLNYLSWSWNAVRSLVFLYPAEWAFLEVQDLWVLFFFLTIQVQKREWNKRRKKMVFWGSSYILSS